MLAGSLAPQPLLEQVGGRLHRGMGIIEPRENRAQVGMHSGNRDS